MIGRRLPNTMAQEMSILSPRWVQRRSLSPECVGCGAHGRVGLDGAVAFAELDEVADGADVASEDEFDSVAVEVV